MATKKIIRALLATALVSMIPLASAEQDSRFTLVNLARGDDVHHKVSARGGSVDLDTYEGGIYKVGFDACQAQIKSAAVPVEITVSDDGKSKPKSHVLSSNGYHVVADMCLFFKL